MAGRQANKLTPKLMALETFQQIEKVLESTKNALLLIPKNPNGDSIGSAWAFYFFLKKKGINSTLAFSDHLKALEKFNFLPQPENIVHEIRGAKDFVLIFNTQENKIMSARTENADGEFKIFITPEHGSIDPRDFSFIPADFKYDLIVAINAPDKESMGEIYEKNPDIFYEVPVVNIDCHSHNEKFGQINLISLNASSTAEIMAELIEKIGASFFDQDIAECLLTGIISATESFQKGNTTPRSLEIAARLMGRGANQQKIIRYLYKTHSFQMLKLWGRIMSRLKWDEELKMVSSRVDLQDFVLSRTTPKDIPLILEKLRSNYSTGEIFMVIYNETPEILKAVIKFSNGKHKEKIKALWGMENKEDFYELIASGLSSEEGETEIINKLKLS
jgi:phosphoesterase RecJ-like protein